MLIEKIFEKKNKEKITCLTAYSYPIAKIVDKYCDMVLVGDSLGMAIYGHEDTVDVSLAMMIDHGEAVTRACENALVIIDLPRGTYEESKEQALESALQVMEGTGCDAVKIEVTPDLVETINFLVRNGIEVVGHVGLLPQHVREIGGYKYQGTDANSAQEILDTSKRIEESGAFCLVIEAVPAILAEKITKSLQIPTIGIGASKECDGQVLVIDDLIGLNQEFKPKFVKNYANTAEIIENAVKSFVEEVKIQKFPGDDHIF